MELKRIGQVGTLESSDVRIVAKPNPSNGLSINVESVVKTQFGDSILKTVKEVLEELKVEDAIIEINDKGALDHVIKSRLEAVLFRAAEVNEYNWERV